MKARFMSGPVAALLVVISALSLLGLLALHAYAPDIRTANSSEANGLSRSAVGFAGLVQLLRLSGVRAEVDRGPLAWNQERPSLTILTPDILSSEKDLADYQRRGPVLVILPKWQTVPNPLRRAWVYKADAYAESFIARQVNRVAGGRAGGGITVKRYPGSARAMDWSWNEEFLRDFQVPDLPTIDSFQTIGGGQALLEADDYGALLAKSRRSGPPIYILSDPDVMNNHGLASEATARMALAIIAALREGNGPVALDVTLNGLGRSPSLLKAVFEPPFLGASICALVAALLIGLHVASRFGPPIEPGRMFARGKKALADNTADLVRMMGREPAMARGYVAGARSLALNRLGAVHAAPGEQDALLSSIERNTGMEEGLAALAAEAEAARTSADLLRIARKTFAWRRGVTGGY